VLGGPYEVKLIDDLLENYNPYERPSIEEHEPLIVEFLITLQQIIDVVSATVHTATNHRCGKCNSPHCNKS